MTLYRNLVNLVFGVSVSFAFLCLVLLIWADEFHPNRKWRSRDEAILEACLPCVSFGYNICCLGGIWEWFYIFEKVMLRAVGSSIACRLVCLDLWPSLLEIQTAPWRLSNSVYFSVEWLHSIWQRKAIDNFLASLWSPGLDIVSRVQDSHTVCTHICLHYWTEYMREPLRWQCSFRFSVKQV